MTKHYHKPDTHSANKLCESRLTLGLVAIALFVLLIAHNSYAHAQLSPYKATYTSNYLGIPTQMNRQLRKADNNVWSLRNDSSIWFVSFEEKASFLQRGSQLIPVSYQYENSLSKKRDSKLQFDWQKRVVKDTKRSTPPVQLPDKALDKITFQLQLRLDLLKQGKDFKEKQYTLVDGDRLKTYTLTYLGEEQLSTAAGTFNTTKLKQQRPGKNKHTVIWLANDWQYLILQIERFEDGDSRYKIELKSATIDGNKLITKASANHLTTN